MLPPVESDFGFMLLHGDREGGGQIHWDQYEESPGLGQARLVRVKQIRGRLREAAPDLPGETRVGRRYVLSAMPE